MSCQQQDIDHQGIRCLDHGVLFFLTFQATCMPTFPESPRKMIKWDPVSQFSLLFGKKNNF